MSVPRSKIVNVIKKLIFSSILAISCTDAFCKVNFNAVIPLAPSSYIPSEYVDSYSKYVYRFVFDTLFAYDENYGVSPHIIDSWSVSADQKKYSFILKRNILFHNGKNLTAKDAIFSLNEMRKATSSIKEYLKPIAEIKERSKYSFDVVLSKPFPFLVTLLASTYSSIVPDNYSNIGKINFSKSPIGTGPFYFVSKSDKVISLKKFEKYHHKNILIDSINIHIAKNSNEAIQLLRIKNIHDINPILHLYRDDLLHILIKNKYKELSYPMFHTVFIGLNQKSALLQNAKIRDDIRNIFYKKEFVNLLPSAKNALATGFIPLGMIGSIPSNDFKLTPISSKDLTRKLIGEKKQTLKLLHYYSTSVNENIQKYINVNLDKKLPFSVKSISVSTENLKEAVVNGNYDMVILNWGGEIVHPIFYIGSFYSQSNENYLAINDSFFDALIDNYSAMSREQETKYFRTMDQYLIDKRYIIPLFYPISSYYFPHSLENFIPSINGICDFDFTKANIND